MELKKRNLRMGDLVITDNPEQYCILGLGSCIGLVIYDNNKSKFGLAHIALPSSEDYKNISKSKNHSIGYYADLAIQYIVKEFQRFQIKNSLLNAKIVGGSKIFENDPINIGKKNTIVTKKELSKYNIKIISEYVGGNSGVSIYSIYKDSTLEIRSNGKKFKL
ncbi:MAG: chemotaxis protein CheD [Promethearchaeota archaeon]